MLINNCWEKKQNNESSKQIWTLTTTKLIIAQKIPMLAKTRLLIMEQKISADNTQMNDS